MKQTGELLKQARENKKLSLHEIGMSLKINPKTLQAIEEGDTSRLPQKTFLRGFVKSYSQYLKLDTPAMMMSFDRETSGEPPIAMTPIVEKDPVPTPPIAPTPVPTQARPVPKLSERAPSHVDHSKAAQTQKMIFFLVGLLAVTMIVLVAKLVNKYQKERGGVHTKVEVAETLALPPDGKIDPTVIKTDAIPGTPSAGIPVTTDSNAPATTSTASPPIVGTTAIAPSVVTPAPTPAVAETKPVVETKPVKADETTAPVTPGKPQEVIVEATGKVSIKYQLDDAAADTVEMSVDDMHTFKCKSSMVLEVSDAGAINVIVNGRFRGSPGKAGSALKLRYPK